MNIIVRVGPRIAGVVAVLAVVLALAACQNMPQGLPDDAAATVAAGYGRAFGRLEYLEDGKDGRSALESMRLFLRSGAGGQIQPVFLQADGQFYWPLLPGDYVILGYQLRHFMGSSRTGRLAVAFSVPSAGQAVYIGDLRIRAERNRHRFEIVDRYPEATKSIETRLAAGGFQPLRSPMRLEGPVGNYARVSAICSPAWGLQCTSRHRGVEPLRPKNTDQGMPLTDAVVPLLEWKPVARTGVSYDIAIYESVTLLWGLAANQQVSRLRGTLVDYAEGLAEPRYTPRKLEPAKAYEWTVRLREGDSVSSWSSIGTVMMDGAVFGFVTPQK